MNTSQGFKWQLTYRNDKIVEFIGEDGERTEFPWTQDGRLDLLWFYSGLRQEAEYESMDCLHTPEEWEQIRTEAKKAYLANLEAH